MMWSSSHGETRHRTSAHQAVRALFHPKLAQVYRAKVEDLLAVYTTEASRVQAQDLIRGLIERIVLTPVDGVL